MTKREDVIRTLINHSSDDHDCTKCSYFKCDDCIDYLMMDAAQLLKAQEPRVLTLVEVEDALDTVVWVERPGDENLVDGFGLIVVYSHKEGWMCIQRPFGEDPSEDDYDYSDYGKGWRCWSARPTDEQRKAVRWDDSRIDKPQC